LARDVVAHVVDYSADVLRERAGMSEVPVFADFDDPVAACAAIRGVIERVLGDPERSTHDALGGMTVESLASDVYKDRASRRAPIV
jgi:hypothetical protein